MNTQTVTLRSEHTAPVTTVITDSATPLETATELAELGESCGDFKPYDAQLPIAEIAGTRIVKCLYQRSAKTGEKVQENSYVRIPCKHLTEELIAERIAELTPYVLSYLQEQENEIIKADHKLGLLKVYCEALSIDKLIEKLEAQEVGARLNKDKIEAWFVAELEPSLTLKFAEKLGLTEESGEAELQKLEMILNAYKKKFASLASGKTFIKEDDCFAMRGVIVAAEATSSLIGARFMTRLENMSKKEDDLLLSL